MKKLSTIILFSFASAAPIMSGCGGFDCNDVLPAVDAINAIKTDVKSLLMTHSQEGVTPSFELQQWREKCDSLTMNSAILEKTHFDLRKKLEDKCEDRKMEDSCKEARKVSLKVKSLFSEVNALCNRVETEAFNSSGWSQTAQTILQLINAEMKKPANLMVLAVCKSEEQRLISLFAPQIEEEKRGISDRNSSRKEDAPLLPSYLKEPASSGSAI